MLNSREREIFEIIKKHPAITTPELENYLGLSKRSVRYALKTLREKLEEHGVCISYHQNRGYYLSEMDEEIYQKIIKTQTAQIVYPKTKYERFIYLLGLLLIEDQIDKEQIEEDIFLSTSTIHNDMKAMYKVLETDFEHSLDSKITFKKKLQIFQRISQKENYLSENAECKNLIFFFGKYYDSDRFRYILNEVIALDKEISNYKSYQTAWILYFINTISSMRAGDNYSNFNKGIINHKIINILQTNLRFTVEEYVMIDRTLISVGWLEITSIEFFRIKKVTNNYLTKVINTLELIIEIDKQEITSFISHLVSLNQRVIDNALIVSLENNDILVHYPFAYYLANEFMIELFPCDYPKITSAEVSMITIYLQVILFSTPRKLRTLLVCGSGFGMTNMMYKWVEKYFHNRLEVVDYCSIGGIESYTKEHEIDLILSTLSLPAELSCKNLEINKLPSVADIQRVEEIINSYNVNVNYLNKILVDKSINIFQKKISFENVITHCCNKLVDEGVINDANTFIVNLLTREKIHSTYFGNGIIVPHPTKIYSKETRMCINVLNEPIKVYGNEVDVIIVLVLNNIVEKNIGSIYELILQLVRNGDLKNKLTRCKSSHEVIMYLSKIINNI